MEAKSGIAKPQAKRGEKIEQITSESGANGIPEQRVKARRPIEPYLAVVRKALAACDGEAVSFTKQDRVPLLVINSLLWMSKEQPGLLEGAKIVAESLDQRCQIEHLEL